MSLNAAKAAGAATAASAIDPRTALRMRDAHETR
jgi:hypothetical protein